MRYYLSSILCIISIILSAQSYSYYDTIQWIDSGTDYQMNNVSYSKTSDPFPNYKYEFKLPYAGAVEVVLDKKIKFFGLNWQSTYTKLPDNIDIDLRYETRGNEKFAIITFPLGIRSSSSSVSAIENFQLKINLFKDLPILNTGQWVKVKVSESGVYKITYDDLVSYGFANPKSVCIFGNDSGELSQQNGDPEAGSLREIPLEKHFGSDAILNKGDYILFYGRLPETWEYDNINKKFIHNKHNFCESSYYFITVDNGNSKNIVTLNSPSSYEKTITSYDEYYYVENDNSNLVKSGSEWYESFIEKDIDFNFENYQTGKSVKIDWRAIVGAPYLTSYSVFADGNLIEIDTVGSYGSSGNFGIYSNVTKDISVSDGSISLKFKYSDFGIEAKAWLDYVRISTLSKLKKNSKQLHFRASESIQYSSVRYQIESTSELNIWDITDYEKTIKLTTSYTNGQLYFNDNSNSLKQYVAFKESECLTPEFVSSIKNQNLVGDSKLDMIIVCHDDFKESAQKLADMHTSLDGFNVKIVSQFEIFNEFSAGKPDVSAIRNYFRHVYFNSSKDIHKLKYVLLMGDGSYDNRNFTEDTKLIMTYQSKASINPGSTFISDDFFAIFENDKGVDNSGSFTGSLLIGMGRFPVNDKTEAEYLVNKTINYATDKEYRGSWQNDLCFIADDLDGGSVSQSEHMTYADKLTTQINESYPFFNFEKIFTDAFKQTTTAAGERYPDANKAIQDRVKKGALIINYTGHGSEYRFAGEDIVNENELMNWENEKKLPLIITASCEISRFDDYSIKSLGEKMILHEKGGAIALLSTTRVVYSSSNYTLNSTLFKYLFNEDETGRNITLGEAIRLTKNASGDGFNQNSRSFVLLGDPALRLAVPRFRVITDSINGKNISQISDTLGALSFVSVSGHLENELSEKSQKSGKLKVVVYDKPKLIRSLGNDGFEPVEFYVQNTILFRGNVSVENGHFSFDFILPKDISYQTGSGKISMYYWDGEIDGTGSTSDFIISGSNPTPILDEEGPEIALYMNDTTFRDGDKTNQNPELLVKVFDKSGINVSDYSIGHEAIATLDDDVFNQQILNEFYEASLNSYQRGEFRYPYSNLEVGKHSIKVKVWDVFNNSSEEEINFYVTNSDKLQIYDLLNFPNPAKTYTNFTFKHNQSDQELDVIVRIYSIYGQRVAELEYNILPVGFNSGEMKYDFELSSGNIPESGIYLYTITVSNEDGKSSESSSKLIIIK